MSGHLVIPDNNQYFSQYLQLIEKTLNPRHTKIDEDALKLKEFIKKEGIEQSIPFSNELSEYEHETYHLSQIYYGSYLLSIFLFMEDKLKKLCNYLKHIKQQPFSPKDIKGEGFAKYLIYIIKITGKDFPVDPKLKSELNTLRIIRNAIVHNDYRTKPDQMPVIKDFIAGHEGLIEMGEFYPTIYITNKYAKELMIYNEKLCQEISQQWVIDDEDFENYRYEDPDDEPYL
jgi:hypothetical protein